MSPGPRTLAARVTAVIVLALASALLPVTGAAAQQGSPGLEVKENRARVTVTGPGFTLRLSPHRLSARVDDDRFGDPGSGNPVVRDTVDLTGLELRSFECQNGTYSIETGTFDRTFRVSTFEPRPLPYTEEFNEAFPGIFTPFVGELRGTATDTDGRTFRFLVSDVVEEVVTDDGFASTVAIHGFFVDQRQRVTDRISLIGRINVGPEGEDASYLIEDRGTCRQTADLPYGPGSAGAVVTGPLFVLPFGAPVTEPT